MALLKVGFWHKKFFPGGFWHEDFWQDYPCGLGIILNTSMESITTQRKFTSITVNRLAEATILIRTFLSITTKREAEPATVNRQTFNKAP